MILASWGALERLHGGLFGRLRGLEGRLGGIVRVWDRYLGLSGLLGPSWKPLETLCVRLGALWASQKPTRHIPAAPGSAQERPRAPGNPWVRPLKKLQPWLLAVAAAAQQHSCEPWGTPLRARGTVADNYLCASAAGPLENAISYLCVCVLLQGCRKEDPQTECCGKNGKTLKRGDLVDS